MVSNFDIRISTDLPQVREYKNVICNLDSRFEFGLYYDDGSIIPNSGIRRYGSSDYGPQKNIDTSCIKISRHVTQPVLFLGHIRNHYGHFLIDGMSKIWPLFHEEYYKEAVIAIFTPGRTRFMEDILRYVGVVFNGDEVGEKQDDATYRNILDLNTIEGAVYFDKVIVPEQSYVVGKVIYKEYYDTFQKISGLVRKSPNAPKKVYLSRSHLVKRNRNREYGGKYVDSLLERAGYTVLYPEEMSIAEQIGIYSVVDELISPDGSIAHNILWCRPQTRQRIIQRLKIENSHQILINSLIGNPVKNIDVSHSKATHECNCYRITTEMKEFLRETGINRTSVLSDLKTNVFFNFFRIFGYIRKCFRKA